MLRKVAAALNNMHHTKEDGRPGVVHHDVQTSTIMLTRSHLPKVIWGGVHPHGEQPTSSGVHSIDAEMRAFGCVVAEVLVAGRCRQGV